MTHPRRGLGRGLDALFSGTSRTPPPEQDTTEEIEDAPAEEERDDPPRDEGPPRAEPAPPQDRQQDPAPAEEPVDEDEALEFDAYDVDDEPDDADDAYFREPEPAAVEEPPAPAEPEPAHDARHHGHGPAEVDVDLIAPNPEQPRTNFDPARLHELADSIREHGVIQPLVVSYESDGTYRLIAGERRLQAARLAGLRTVPVVIREVVDSELLELAIVENVQRADLNPIEEALAFRRLIDEYRLTQEETAHRVGKSRTAIANSLRLLQLETDVRRALINGEISEGHARALLGLPEGHTRLAALRDVIRRGMSVRDTEALVRRNLAAKPETSDSPGAVTARRDVAISDVETRLRRALSTRVTVDPHKGGGARIVIECFSREEFDNVVSRLTEE